ncbi:MAG: molybdate ABC transporter substrate-binding protein [Pseudomonadota bacterium]|nr:molybdate ABC transporter substrate-binding protein [Pseudomonadota bacterium]
MKRRSSIPKLAVLSLLLLGPGRGWADEIRVAVASNFGEAIKEIAQRFEVQTGHEVVLVIGSTGKQYAQIKNGAPFDAFFAADARRPELLEDEGAALAGSRFTYARGRILLWSPRQGYVDPEGQVLEEGGFRHLAIANPRLAPYGKAAQQVLENRGLWDGLQGRMVRGENIGQTFQFVKSGNAELGLVAYSQVKRPGHALEGSYWEVPQSLYSPIEQQAVLLKDNAAARGFLDFVRGDEAGEIIRGYGYDTP